MEMTVGQVAELVEYAGQGRAGTFPPQWGTPPAEPDRRAYWVAGHVSKRTGRPVRALTSRAETRASRGRDAGLTALHNGWRQQLWARRLCP